MGKKTICIVFSNTELKNGATRSMLDLIESWINNQQVKIIALVRDDGELKKYLETLGIETLVFHYNGVRYYTKNNTLIDTVKDLIRRLILLYERILVVHDAKKILKNRSIDIIYTNTGAIFFGAWLSKSLGIPHIWHIRELGEEDQNARYLWGRRYFIRLLKCSNAIICISRTVYDKYVGLIGNTKNVYMYYNDLSEKNINWQERLIPKDKFNILIAGSVIEGKGQEQVICAVNGLRKNNIPAELFIAGSAVGKYADNMRQLVAENHLEEYVHFLGQVKDMQKLKKDMHVEVVASRCEAFGRITIEAMLNGLPVVGANTGGTAELIKDKENGYLYEWGNVSQLVAQLTNIYFRYEDSLAIAQNAFDYAIKFTVGATANKIMNNIILKLD